MISLKNIGMRFQAKTEAVWALRDVNLEIKQGEFVSIVGPSGCGKSTILRLVGGLIAPTEGTITVGSETPDEARLARRFGVVFQNSVMLPWRTAIENLTLPIEIIGMPPESIPIAPSKLLEIVGLKGAEDRFPRQLSGGMRQRVAIARALSFDPPILLMDEPFGALDALTRDRLQSLTVDIWEKNHKTVLFITHDVYEAVYLSDRVVIMSSTPGSIQQIIDVDLPRPRDDSTKEDPRFTNTTQKILKSIKH